MNLEVWTDNTPRALEDWLMYCEGYFMDQLALNCEFQSDVDFLPWDWNVLQTQSPVAACGGAKIVHFNGRDKPWNSFGCEDECLPACVEGFAHDKCLCPSKAPRFGDP